MPGEKSGWHTSATPKNMDLSPVYTELELLAIENDKLGMSKSKDRVQADYSEEGVCVLWGGVRVLWGEGVCGWVCVCECVCVCCVVFSFIFVVFTTVDE